MLQVRVNVESLLVACRNLHGHLSLLKDLRNRCAIVVLSKDLQIFDAAVRVCDDVILEVGDRLLHIDRVKHLLRRCERQENLTLVRQPDVGADEARGRDLASALHDTERMLSLIHI